MKQARRGEWVEGVSLLLQLRGRTQPGQWWYACTIVPKGAMAWAVCGSGAPMRSLGLRCVVVLLSCYEPM